MPIFLLATMLATPVPLALDPLPMSDVQLTGEWGQQQIRNRDNLLSINLTAWACHFTTTANLTACRAATSLWHTWTKDAHDNFTHKLGFLAAGDDVKPPEMVTFAECKAFCVSSSACKGITFSNSQAAPGPFKIKCYWKTTVAHFTPQSKSANCLTPGDPTKPACAPLPGEMGLGGYYGHFQGHWLSATAFLINNTGDAAVRARADAAIDLLGGVMEAWKSKYHYDGYLFPFEYAAASQTGHRTCACLFARALAQFSVRITRLLSPVVWDRLLAGHGARPYYSVPFYTLHKLMAGLLDQYVFAGSKPALSLVEKMALWVHDRVETTIAAGGQALWQRVLLTEWGGMNDVLLELYRHTRNPMHYASARRFNGFVFTARLSVGEDDLALLPFPHANFHLPEIIGNARAYELTGNLTDRAIVHTFFEALTSNHSFCTGGSNSGECWQAPRDLGNFLSTQTEESCTQYNVLKIARHLHRWHAESKYADFYERAILNGIVGNQKKGQSTCGTPGGGCSKCGGAGDGGNDEGEGHHGDDCRAPGLRGAAPNTTSYIYMLPLGGAVTKHWGKSDYGFPCCWGTLSESFAKLSDSIFFAAPDASALYVDLYESATLKWAARPGISIEQTGHFPLGTKADPHATTTLVVRVADLSRGARATFALKVRVPGWVAGAHRLTLNGEPFSAKVEGGYLTASREWHDADTLAVSFPAALWSAPLNDKHAWHNATVAFMYGPLVLAGVDVSTDIFVPPDGGVADPSSFLKRNASATGRLEFVATARSGATMRVMPVRDVMDERYVVYFYTAGTKPPQPKVVYCPHSHGDASASHADAITGAHHDASVEEEEEADDGHGHGEEEDALFAAGAPPSSPPAVGSFGRGVQWAVDPDGHMVSKEM